MGRACRGYARWPAELDTTAGPMTNDDPLQDFFDDALITSSDVLYRAVSPSLIDDWDSFTGRDSEIPSRIWQDQRAEVAASWGLRPCASVAVARLLDEHNCDIHRWLEASFAPKYGVVAINACDVRQATSPSGQQVPQGLMLFPTMNEPWHAVVWRKRGPKRNKLEMKTLAAISRWIKVPVQG
jgi:hypothetical protein